MFQDKRRYVIGFFLGFLIHCFAVVFFRIGYGPVAGPNADSDAIAWSIWVIVDFPLGILYFWLWDFSDGIAIVGMCFIGGIQWGFWVIVAVAIVSYLRFTNGIR